MAPIEIGDRLEANAGVFRQLLAAVNDEQARWRPAAGKWSLLEVVNHLADEERHDFRQRLAIAAEHPGEACPPIDPVGWVADRQYNARELASSLEDFLDERARSLRWLRSLAPVDPDAWCRLPSGDRLTARVIQYSWLAHDLIHIRQMTRLHYEYLQERAGAETLVYAGPW